MTLSDVVSVSLHIHVCYLDLHLCYDSTPKHCLAHVIALIQLHLTYITGEQKTNDVDFRFFDVLHDRSVHFFGDVELTEVDKPGLAILVG